MPAATLLCSRALGIGAPAPESAPNVSAALAFLFTALAVTPRIAQRRRERRLDLALEGPIILQFVLWLVLAAVAFNIALHGGVGRAIARML